MKAKYEQDSATPVVMPAPAAPNSPASVQSVGVAFTVLEELANSSGPVGISEVARRLGQTKARVHRHLATLRDLGFVEKDSSSDRYQLGWKAYRLALRISEDFALRQLARPHLAWLHEVSHQTAVLAMPAGVTDVTVVETLAHSDSVAITVRSGSVIPAVSSALGRVILAFQSEQARAQALAAPVDMLTAHTPEDPVALAAQLERVRQRWYELAVNERLPGVAALAAPVFDARGEPVAAVGLIGAQTEIAGPQSQALTRWVQDAAVRVSAALHSNTWERAPQRAM